jgi:hypothetical protein
LLAKLTAGATFVPLAGRAGVRLLDAPGVLGVVLVDGPSGLEDLPALSRIRVSNDSGVLHDGGEHVADRVHLLLVGTEHDLAAVVNGLSLPHSSGAVGGIVNRTAARQTRRLHGAVLLRSP